MADPPPSRPRGVHEADIARWNAAQVALQREHELLVADAGDRVGAAADPYAYRYATAVLRGDDTHGRQGGWVTRADLVRWHDLVVLARVATRLVDPAHTGQHQPKCEGCDLRLAVARLREAAMNAGVRGDGQVAD